MSEKKMYTKEEIKKIEKQIFDIKRKNKLYVRCLTGEVRKLENVSEELYGLVIKAFLSPDSPFHKEYATANKNANKMARKHWWSWKKTFTPRKPIKLGVPDELIKEYGKLMLKTGRYKNIVVFYNDTRIPLVSLSHVKKAKNALHKLWLDFSEMVWKK